MSSGLLEIEPIGTDLFPECGCPLVRKQLAQIGWENLLGCLFTTVMFVEFRAKVKTSCLPVCCRKIWLFVFSRHFTLRILQAEPNKNCSSCFLPPPGENIPRSPCVTMGIGRSRASGNNSREFQHQVSFTSFLPVGASVSFRKWKRQVRELAGFHPWVSCSKTRYKGTACIRSIKGGALDRTLAPKIS